MGGVGSLLAFFVGSILYKMDPSYPFLASGAVMLAACMLVVVLVNEPEEFKVKAGSISFVELMRKSLVESFSELLNNLREAFTSREKSLLFMLSSIFLWFIGYNAIETFFTSYAKYHLGIGEATGSFILGFVALGFLMFSLPAGFIGAKLGRRRTMTLGLVMIVALMLIAMSFPVRLQGDQLILAFEVTFLVLGIAWGLVNVNSLPTVVDMTTREKLGAFTGLYYFASQSAAIIAPPLAGLFIDMLGFQALFPYSIVFLALSVVTLQLVRRGEPRKGY
jgi:MFS-type transporter involved in bile tolerance (Atg22 family)